jgi:SPP1 gp7 family putative phage head morphogenesis protein
MLSPRQLLAVARTPAFQAAALKVAERMVGRLDTANAKSWREAAMKGTHSREIFNALRQELGETSTRRAIRAIALENAKLIQSVPINVAERIIKQAVEYQAAGKRAEEFEGELQAKLKHLTASRIHLIARTEIGKAESAITQVRSQELGIEWFQWLDSGDQRVRKSHRNMNKVLVNWNDLPSPEVLVGEKSAGRYGPGGIYNCFTGDTKVTAPSGIKTLWRAPYRGDIVQINLEGGIFFRVTPNHPILTEHGWVAARALDVGNNLVRLFTGWHTSIEPNVNDGVPTFSEVFDAASLCGNRSSSFGLNFHGDVIRDDIDQISIADDLYFDGQSGRPHSVGKFSFPDTNGGIRQVVPGVSLQIGSASATCLLDELPTLFGRHALHPDAIGISSGSWSDPVALQVFANYTATDFQMERDALFAPLLSDIEAREQFRIDYDPKAVDSGRKFVPETCFSQSVRQVAAGGIGASAKGRDRLAGLQALTRITKKSVSEFSGHVFTMETRDGWYGVTSTSIISKNCRCITLPLVSLDEVSWPAKVYYTGQITRMTRAQFQRVSGMPKAA